MLPVRRVVEVIRTGAKVTVFETPASGSVTPPRSAQRAEGDALAWTDADAMHNTRCPACVSARPCVQRIEARANGSLSVVREYEGGLPS